MQLSAACFFFVHLLQAAHAAASLSQVTDSQSIPLTADGDPPTRAHQPGGPPRSHQGAGCHQRAVETSRTEENGGSHSSGPGDDAHEPITGTGGGAGAGSHAHAGSHQLGQQPGGAPSQVAARELQGQQQPRQGQRPLWPRIPDGAGAGGSCQTDNLPPHAGTADLSLPSNHPDPGDARDTRLLPSPRFSSSSPCATPWRASS